jgi:hypothetical protein
MPRPAGFARTICYMGVFVGRRDELTALGEIPGAAAHGDVAAAVLVGDPGCGKSRLLAESSEQARLLNRFRVVGYEPERDVPLASAAELLRALADVKPHGRRLEALVFDPGREHGSSLEPLRVFEATHRALRVLAPALVLVDDLQWLDDLSLALCHYLVRGARAGGEPLALLAVGRPSPKATSFVDSLAQVLPPERLRRRELGPLVS